MTYGPRIGTRHHCRAAAGFVALASMLTVTGCAEHRMTLAEFLDRQQVAAQPAPAEPVTPVMRQGYLGPYRLGVGDDLSIQLLGPDGTALFPVVATRVDTQGRIDLPIVGKVGVADKTLPEADEAVCDAFVPAVYRDAVCHVAVNRPEVTNVFVIGEVPEPGVVQLNRTHRNMLSAISAAGGLQPLASGKATLRRLRSPSEAVTLDVTNPSELAAALALDPLQDGDIIDVHTGQPNTVFVGGLVLRPGPQEYPEGADVTVLQALAAASGLRTDVFPTEATLVRRTPSGDDLHVKLDLNRITKGQDPNIRLAGGDILWVPHTVGTRVTEWINQHIFLRGGVSATYTATGVEFLNRRDLQTAQIGGRNLENTFDPLGFLGRNTALQNINQVVQP